MADFDADGHKDEPVKAQGDGVLVKELTDEFVLDPQYAGTWSRKCWATSLGKPRFEAMPPTAVNKHARWWG